MLNLETAEKLLDKTIKKHNSDCPIIYELNFDEKQKKLFVEMLKKFAKQHVMKCIDVMNEKAINSSTEQISNGVLIDAYQLNNIK